MANDDTTTSSTCPPPVERRRRVQPSSPMAVLTQLPALVVLDRLPVPVLAVDLDGAITFANKAFAALLGYRLLELTALTFDQIFDGLPPAPSAVWAAHNQVEQVVTLKRADGFAVRAKMSKSSLLRADDSVTLTTFQDLTDELWINGP